MCPSSALNFFTGVILMATDPPCHDPHSGVMSSAGLKIKRAEPRLSDGQPPISRNPRPDHHLVISAQPGLVTAAWPAWAAMPSSTHIP